MYRVLCIKILHDDKIESPMHLLHSVVQMCTVWPWCLLASSNTNSRKVFQFDATKGAVFGEHSSTHLFKSVRKVFLRAVGWDKAEVRQYCFIFCKSTVLDLQRHRLCELAGRWDPEDRAEEVCTLRKLKLPRETHSDVDLALSHISWEAVFWNMKPQSIPLPVKWASFSWNCKLYFPSYFDSVNRAWKCEWKCTHRFFLTT